MRRFQQGPRAAPRISPRKLALPSARQTHAGPISQRTRGLERNERLPFVPPEDWHEPRDVKNNYRVIVQPAGEGFRHVVTVAEVRERLAELPSHFVEGLEVLQFSRMTRKKRSFPCYGMQWGAAIYLYPIEDTLEEYYELPPKPAQINEARMYGGVWSPAGPGAWKLVWTESAIKDFYLNNILIHELGHLVDDRNNRPIDRERYAEWFAIEHGYLRSRRTPSTLSRTVRRHGKR